MARGASGGAQCRGGGHGGAELGAGMAGLGAARLLLGGARFGRGSKLNDRRGKPQILVHVSTCQGGFWYRIFGPEPLEAPAMSGFTFGFPLNQGPTGGFEACRKDGDRREKIRVDV